MMKRLFLGWDVGAWHCDKNRKSQDALWLLTAEDGAPNHAGVSEPSNLREILSKYSGRRLLEAMVELCGAALSADDEIWIAIDTPLGWPTDFRELLEGRAPASVADRYSHNRLIFRRTEQWLSAPERRHLLGGRQTPLSAVQDQLGSQSTKGLLFLSRVGVTCDDTGVWRGQGVTVIEAYPTPCRKREPLGEPFLRLRQAEGAPAPPTGDQEDALTCALVAWFFAEHRGQLEEPPEDVDRREGWIWIPKETSQAPPPGDPV